MCTVIFPLHRSVGLSTVQSLIKLGFRQCLCGASLTLAHGRFFEDIEITKKKVMPHLRKCAFLEHTEGTGGRAESLKQCLFWTAGHNTRLYE